MSEATTRLFLIRHGATKANLSDPPILQGSRIDYPLDELGKRQAEALGLALRSVALSAIYSSPLLRAVQTAAAVALGRRLSVEIVPEFIEADIGVWEGLDWGAIKKRWPIEQQAFQDDSAVHPYLGGENMTQVCDRASAALAKLAEKHAGQSFAVACHNGVNRALIARWLGLPIKYARKIPQNNGGYNLAFKTEHGWRLEMMNCTVHLSALSLNE